MLFLSAARMLGSGQLDLGTKEIIFRLLCAMDAPIMQLVTQRSTLENAFLRATSQE